MVSITALQGIWKLHREVKYKIYNIPSKYSIKVFTKCGLCNRSGLTFNPLVGSVNGKELTRFCVYSQISIAWRLHKYNCAVTSVNRSFWTSKFIRHHPPPKQSFKVKVRGYAHCLYFSQFQKMIKAESWKIWCLNQRENGHQTVYHLHERQSIAQMLSNTGLGP